MALAVPAQAPKASRAAAGAESHGLSPAAQALAPKKPSGFLQLFRRIAGAGGNALAGHSRGSGAAGEASSGQTAVTGKTRASQGQPEAATATGRGGEARRGRRLEPRRGQQALSAGWPEAAALPAPTRRARAGAPQEAQSASAVEAGRGQRLAKPRVYVVDLRVRPAAVERQTAGRGQAPVPERAENLAPSAREPGSAAPTTIPTSVSGFAPAGPPTSMAGHALPGSVSVSALRERLLPEIVQQAGIILRDGGEGEIRLVLKPEHLGSLRIRLQLGESSLEGRIVVDNSNVKELLEAHLEQLKSALRQEGWASANIDVTLSGGGGDRRDPTPAAPQAVAGRTAGQFERATPASMELDLGFTAVNLLA